jgi:ABC-type transport system involved in cytochrome bd biosynthesis fused ATPase/permease subunit
MNIPMERIAAASPRPRARITAVFYLFTILMGGLVLFVHGRLALVVDLIATACYLAVTALFYDLSKPVNRSLSFARSVLQPRALNDGRNGQAQRRND